MLCVREYATCPASQQLVAQNLTTTTRTPGSRMNPSIYRRNQNGGLHNDLNVPNRKSAVEEAERMGQ